MNVFANEQGGSRAEPYLLLFAEWMSGAVLFIVLLFLLAPALGVSTHSTHRSSLTPRWELQFAFGMSLLYALADMLSCRIRAGRRTTSIVADKSDQHAAKPTQLAWSTAAQSTAALAVLCAIRILPSWKRLHPEWLLLACGLVGLFAGIWAMTLAHNRVQAFFAERLVLTPPRSRNSYLSQPDARTVLFRPPARARATMASMAGLVVVMFGGGLGFVTYSFQSGAVRFRSDSWPIMLFLWIGSLLPLFACAQVLATAFCVWIEFDLPSRKYRQQGITRLPWRQFTPRKAPFGLRLVRNSGSLDEDIAGLCVMEQTGNNGLYYQVCVAWKQAEHPPAFLSQMMFDADAAKAVMEHAAAMLDLPALGYMMPE